MSTDIAQCPLEAESLLLGATDLFLVVDLCSLPSFALL